MSKEQAIIDLVTGISGQTEAMSDDAYWDPATRQVYTTDMLVDKRHFSLDYFTPQDLGWKAAAVNISDLAGMGARLKYLMVSIGLPSRLDLAFVKGLYEGLQEACQTFQGTIIGGDTVSADTLTLNITAIGECAASHHPGHRFQAKPGDIVIASGFHGLSKAGLHALQNHWPLFKTSKAAHLRPMPRIEAGLMLARKFERYALMDSSDGLADALLKIAQSSRQSLIVEQRKVHIHPEVSAYSLKAASLDRPGKPEDLALETALYGGEDFELIATVPSLDAEILSCFHVIGRVAPPEAPGIGAWLETSDGTLRPLEADKTYQHFEKAHENT